MKHEDMSRSTRLTLAASLKELMARKPLKRITVAELVAGCGLNRNTFYYHFEDIYALFRWMLEAEAYETFQQFDLEGDHEQAFMFVADYVMQNRVILSSAVDGMGLDSLRRFLHSDLHRIIRGVIASAAAKAGTPCDPAYLDFLTDMYTEATAGMLIRWLRQPDSYTKEQLVRYMERAFLYALPGALAEPK